VNAPTPAEAFGHPTPLPARVFDARGPVAGQPPTEAQRRRRALDRAHDRTEQLLRALAALRSWDEADVDLHLEKYRRVAPRLDDALDDLDTALADVLPLVLTVPLVKP